MHAYQIFRCGGPIFVECWRCNACEAITWVANGREEVEDLLVIHNIEDDLIDVMEWTGVHFHANVTIKLSEVEVVPIIIFL